MTTRAKAKATEVRAIRTNLKPELVKEMLESEAQTLKSLFKELKKGHIRMKVSIPEFVERCFMLHRDLIERWGGWRYQGSEHLVDDPAFSRTVATQEYNAFVRSVQTAVRNKELEASWQTVVGGFQLLGQYDGVISQGMLLSNKNLQDVYTHDAGQGRLYYTPLVGEEAHIPLIQHQRPTRTPHEASVWGSRMTTWVVAKVRVGQRISSAVIRALEEEGAPDVLVKLYEKLFQRLGEQAWAGQSIPIRCTLSCAPSSFIRLGEYGENSCYQNTGAAEYSKFFLASDVANSFVALFHRLKEKGAEPGSEQQISGRAWGMACPKRGAMISNFYLLPQNMVLPCFKETLSEGMGMKEITEITLTGLRWYDKLTDSAYVNGDTKVLGSKSAVKQKLMDHYFYAILNVAAYYGFYSNRGAGPQFVKLAENAWEIAGPKGPGRYRTLWPYKDVNLKELIVTSGAFSPLKGPTYQEEDGGPF